MGLHVPDLDQRAQYSNHTIWMFIAIVDEVSNSRRGVHMINLVITCLNDGMLF